MYDLRSASNPNLHCELCGTLAAPGAAACAACGSRFSGAAPRANGATSVIFNRADEESTRALPPGTMLQGGAYHVESVIGQGGFGITYRATDLHLGRQVAIKEFFPASCDRAGRDVRATGGLSLSEFDESRRTFLEEARALAHFRHAGIVHVYAAWEENSSAYMAMELLHGQTLAQLFATRPAPLPENEVLALARDIIGALQIVHDRGWLHRDIKPENIILAEGETAGTHRVVLLDFGAAKQVSSGGQTQQLSVVVTPGYAPLEQYATRARRGAYTDIYALCATLYHALSGEAPPAASDRAVGIELRPLSALNRNVSQSTARAIEAGLEIEIARRPQTLAELRDLLDGLVLPTRIAAGASEGELRGLVDGLDPKPYQSLKAGNASRTLQSTAGAATGGQNAVNESLQIHLSSHEYEQLRSREVQQAMLSRIAQGNAGASQNSLSPSPRFTPLPTSPQPSIPPSASPPSGGLAHRPVQLTPAGRWATAIMVAIGFGVIFMGLVTAHFLFAPRPMSYPMQPSMGVQSPPNAMPSYEPPPIEGGSFGYGMNVGHYTTPWMTASFQHESGPHKLYSPDGSRFAFVEKDKLSGIGVRSAADGKGSGFLRTRRGFNVAPTSNFFWLLDGRHIAAVVGKSTQKKGSQEQATQLCLWDVSSQKLLWQRPIGKLRSDNPSTVTNALSFARNGILVSGQNGSSMLHIDSKSGSVIGIMPLSPSGSEPKTNPLDFTSDGRYLTGVTTTYETSDGKAGEVIDTRAWVWNAANGQKTSLFTLSNSQLVRPLFSPDGQWLWLQWLDGTQHVRVWRVGEWEQPFAEYDIDGSDMSFHPAFSSDGKEVAFALSSNTVRVWNLTLNKTTDYGLSQPSGREGLPAIKFSPSGHSLLILDSANESASSKMQVIDRRSGRTRVNRAVKSVRIFPYGANATFSADDRSLHIVGRKKDGTIDVVPIR